MSNKNSYRLIKKSSNNNCIISFEFKINAIHRFTLFNFFVDFSIGYEIPRRHGCKQHIKDSLYGAIWAAVYSTSFENLLLLCVLKWGKKDMQSHVGLSLVSHVLFLDRYKYQIYLPWWIIRQVVLVICFTTALTSNSFWDSIESVVVMHF